MPRGARYLPIEKLVEEALVVDLGQSIDNGEPVNLLVIFRLDIAPGKKAKDAVPNAQVVAGFELRSRRGYVVNKSAVGALQIDGRIHVGRAINPRMAARNGMLGDPNVAVLAAADEHRLVAQGITLPDAGSRRIDVYQASV